MEFQVIKPGRDTFYLMESGMHRIRSTHAHERREGDAGGRAIAPGTESILLQLLRPAHNAGRTVIGSDAALCKSSA